MLPPGQSVGIAGICTGVQILQSMLRAESSPPEQCFLTCLGQFLKLRYKPILHDFARGHQRSCSGSSPGSLQKACVQMTRNGSVINLRVSAAVHQVTAKPRRLEPSERGTHVCKSLPEVAIPDVGVLFLHKASDCSLFYAEGKRRRPSKKASFARLGPRQLQYLLMIACHLV